VKGSFLRSLYTCRYMVDVEEYLSSYVADINWSTPKAPLIANVDGKERDDAVGVRDAIVAQTSRPVQFLSCVERIKRDSHLAGIEFGSATGSGRGILSGLVASTLRSFSSNMLHDLSSFKEFMEEATAAGDN